MKPYTWKQTREWGLQSHRTAMRLVGAIGPKSASNNWPDYPKEMFIDVPSAIKSVRAAPTAAQITSMEQFFDLLTAVLGEQSRLEVHAYIRAKNIKSHSVRHYCNKNAIAEHIFRYRLKSHFQSIATKATQSSENLLFPSVDLTQETGKPKAQSGSRVSETVWHSPNQSVPDHFDPPEKRRKQLIAMLERRNAQRNREKRNRV